MPAGTITSPPILDETGQDIIAALEDVASEISRTKQLAGVRAVYDESPTLYAHAEGDLIYYNQHFYKAKVAIAVGATLTVGTNIELANLNTSIPVFVDNLPGPAPGGGATSADGISYDNTTSGLVDTNVQTAIDDLEKRKGNNEAFVTYTITAAGWNSGTKVYSFENTYPSSTYDILAFTPNNVSTTDAMLDAWQAAEIWGYEPTNIIRAHGTVPTIDIIMTLTVRYKSANAYTPGIS